MKVERANSVCSDSEGPSSPDSVMSTGEASPLPSPQPSSPAPSDTYDQDQRLYSPSYIAHSPAYSTSSQSSGEGNGGASPEYNYPYSPKQNKKQRSKSPSSHDTFQFPPKASPGGFGDIDDTFGCQTEFATAVRTGNTRELKRILTHYSQLIQINGFTADGQTALTQSCMDGNLEVIKVLLAHGASLHLTNRDGFSPLHLACWRGKYDIMTYLLRSGSSSTRR